MITVMYLGYTINYNEDANTWAAQLGQDYNTNVHAPSLKEAKGKIIKVVKPTERVNAILSLYGDKEVAVTVNPLAEGEYVWVMRGKTRSKERLDNIYEDTLANGALASQREKLYAEIKGLQKQRDELLKQMTHYQPAAVMVIKEAK
jgi:hypothetical protein